MQSNLNLLGIILYCTMGFIGYVCFNQALIWKRNFKYKEKNMIYCILFFIWVLFASFRYVTYRIGGTDALTYVFFFENINSSNLPYYYNHYDVGFWIFTWLIRLFTDNYHIYFLVFYSILIYCYIKFVDEFSELWGVYTSYFMIFFLFLRGFTSLRTNISVAFLLLSLVYFRRKNFLKALIYVIISCFMHKVTILYAMFYVFYFITRYKKLSIKATVSFSIIAGLVGFISRNYISYFFNSSIDAYGYYALRSVGVGFFDNFWKIAFGQLALLVMMVIFNKDIIKLINNGGNKKNFNLEFLRTICLYDFILIPITFYLSIWRGCEYFYVPRLVMWGVIIRIELQKFFQVKYRILYKFFTLLIIIIWFIFRIDRTWEDSSLLPYIFGPLIELD